MVCHRMVPRPRRRDRRLGRRPVGPVLRRTDDAPLPLLPLPPRDMHGFAAAAPLPAERAVKHVTGGRRFARLAVARDPFPICLHLRASFSDTASAAPSCTCIRVSVTHALCPPPPAFRPKPPLHPNYRPQPTFLNLSPTRRYNLRRRPHASSSPAVTSTCARLAGPRVIVASHAYCMCSHPVAALRVRCARHLPKPHPACPPPAVSG